LVFCVLLSVLSAIAFVVQVRYRNEFGDLYRDEPGAWPHLIAHVIRSAVCAVLGWQLWRYLRAARAATPGDHQSLRPLFRSLAGWWNALGASVIVFVIYAVWVGFHFSPPSTSRFLSPRFNSEPPEQAAANVEFRLAESQPGDGLFEVSVVGTPRKVYVHRDALVTNKDIAEARVVADDGEPAVEVTFALPAQQRIRQATAGHLGKPLAILVDGEVINAPIVRFQISDSARIYGRFTREEAERIARSLTGQK
jgi:hypothetical protein